MLHWSDKIKKAFYEAENIGDMDVKNNNVYFAEITTPDQLTKMQLFIKVEKHVIIDAKFKALGCPCTIACLSHVTQKIKQQKVSILQTITAEYLIHELGLPKERYSVAILLQTLLEEMRFELGV